MNKKRFLILAIGLLSMGAYYKIIGYRIIPEKKRSFDLSQNFDNQQSDNVYKEDFTDLEDVKVKRKQLWSSLQPAIKDTVVQVFSQLSEFNWLEPYKTPNQMEVRGSAFFINQDGELITNAHVVNQASIVFIQIPSFGKRRFEVDVLGVSPERDLALLKLRKNEFESIKKELKKDGLQFLKFGDSDAINRADKIMALGFPLGQQGLKSTTGVVSGYEHVDGQHYIQISAPINPGNSGGPSLNNKGEVIGVNSAGIREAQNVGYVIPIKEVELFYDQIKSMPENADGGPKLLRKPYLGVLFNNANDKLTKFLGNPLPGGLYVADIYKGSPLHKLGIKAGDMLYRINGYDIDVYGELQAPWLKEDKISIVDFISRLKSGEKVHIDYYDRGTPKSIDFTFGENDLLPVRRVYPGYEKIDYEIIAGMVIMELTINHIIMLAQFSPELVKYTDLKKHQEPKLIVTHLLLNSPIVFSRTFSAGSLISEINEEKVGNLAELRKVMQKSKSTGYLTIKTTENFFVALPMDEIKDSEKRLSVINKYKITPGAKELLDLKK